MAETRFPNAPAQIAALKLDKRGFPVPWFVPWVDGEPEFRAVDPSTILDAHRHKLCWICGQKLGSTFAFAIGPMCAVNRVSAEPPSHLACARFAVKACPFLSKPLAKRADASDLKGAGPAAGLMIERNPGVTLIWRTSSYRFEGESGSGRNSARRTGLFRIGAPGGVEWYAHGREATREEVIESIETGLPSLRAHCVTRDDLDQLRRSLERAVKLIPD